MSGGGTLLSARALTVFSVEKTISWADGRPSGNDGNMNDSG